MDTGLKGRTVIITGSSRNIGREMALAFAREGANLALCTRKSIDRLEAVAQEARDIGVQAIAAECDITNADSVAAFVRQASEQFGSVDVLINNAVYRGEANFFDIDATAWQRNIDVNLTGPFIMCQHTLPHMQQQQWGRIINFSGIAPFVGHGAAKSMVKIGIVGFTRGLATEVGPENITANCIGPGLIDVERDQWQRDKPVPENQPIQRHGKPEEIAGLAVFLASEQAGFITGQCYLANGGNYYL